MRIVRFFQSLHKNLYKNENGFGLIEISITLIIFSLIFGEGLTLWRAHNRMRKYEVTVRHQLLIFKSLAHYLQNNGCLPYPAPIQGADIKKDRWGQSQYQDLRSGPLKPGIVPYRTLGLPQRVAKDGFGRWMTYAVDAVLTRKGQNSKSKMCERFFSQPSSLDVIENGYSVKQSLEHNEQKYEPAKGVDGNPIGLPRYEGIALVLVSHGRQGWGAPLSTGQRIPFPLSAPPGPRKNGDDGGTFWSSDSDMRTEDYGVVQWKTRTAIMDDAYLGCADYFYSEKTLSRTHDVKASMPPPFHTRVHQSAPYTGGGKSRFSEGPPKSQNPPPLKSQNPAQDGPVLE